MSTRSGPLLPASRTGQPAYVGLSGCRIFSGVSSLPHAAYSAQRIADVLAWSDSVRLRRHNSASKDAAAPVVNEARASSGWARSARLASVGGPNSTSNWTCRNICGCKLGEGCWRRVESIVQSPNGAPQLASDAAMFTAGTVSNASPLQAHSWRLVRKRCGVWISTSARVERMGPRDGICRSLAVMA